MSDKKPSVNELFRQAVTAEMERQKIVSPLALAIRAKVNPQIVRRLLSGEGKNPTLDNLTGLLHGLGRSWEWFADKIKPAYTPDGPKCDNLRAVNMAAKAKSPKKATKKPISSTKTHKPMPGKDLKTKAPKKVGATGPEKSAQSPKKASAKPRPKPVQKPSPAPSPKPTTPKPKPTPQPSPASAPAPAPAATAA